MASPDPQLHPFLVLRQHGHRNRLHPASQPALPVPRAEGYWGGHLLLERLAIRGVLWDLLVSLCVPIPLLLLDVSQDPVLAVLTFTYALHPFASPQSRPEPLNIEI